MSNTGNMPAITMMAKDEDIRGKLAELMDDSASYIQSVLAVCAASDQLMLCTPESVWRVF